MAMNGSLDSETRDNLVRSHAASKVSLYLSSVETQEANIYIYLNLSIRVFYLQSMICWCVILGAVILIQDYLKYG